MSREGGIRSFALQHGESGLEEVECIVAGAGVVGLAVARALALAGREVLILDKAESFGTETSARNSEVIHAGIYYPHGSLMARFCVEGRRALYAYLGERGLPHRRCGKLIVATDAAELEKLAGIRARAAVNGVEDMELLSAAEAQALEPALACTGALLSPSTGIIASPAALMKSFARSPMGSAPPVSISIPPAVTRPPSTGVLQTSVAPWASASPSRLSI